MLRLITQNPISEPFSQPVDPIQLNIPEYLDVIQRPMDLGTIRNKLRARQYSTLLDMVYDVRLTFENALLFNPPGHPVHEAAVDLSRLFSKALEELALKRLTSEEVSHHSIHM